MVEISTIIPVRDEESNLQILADRLKSTFEKMNVSFEIIFVTDINTDNTQSILEELSEKNKNIKTLKLSNRFGQHVAVLAGLDHCQGKFTVIMDGDLQDMPEDIPILYEKICEGYDVVYAEKENKNENYFRNLSSKSFNKIMNFFSDIKVDNNTSMFRIISRRMREEIIRYREFEPSLTYIFNLINFPTIKVRVSSGKREHGNSKYNLSRLISFAISTLLSFSRKPLRMISGIGLFIALLSFIYLIIVLIQYFFFEIEILGWATLIVIITFTSGVQLLGLGVIGEYIGRIFMQTKNRPLYVIDKKIGKFDN